MQLAPLKFLLKGASLALSSYKCDSSLNFDIFEIDQANSIAKEFNNYFASLLLERNITSLDDVEYDYKKLAKINYLKKYFSKWIIHLMNIQYGINLKHNKLNSHLFMDFFKLLNEYENIVEVFKLEKCSYIPIWLNKPVNLELYEDLFLLRGIHKSFILTLGISD